MIFLLTNRLKPLLVLKDNTHFSASMSIFFQYFQVVRKQIHQEEEETGIIP